LNPGPPASISPGLKLEIEGTGLPGGVIGKVRTLEGPPPGAGLVTPIVAVASEAMPPAGTDAASSEAETKVVFWFTPFQRTAELGTNLLPITVSTKAGAPAGRLA